VLSDNLIFYYYMLMHSFSFVNDYFSIILFFRQLMNAFCAVVSNNSRNVIT